MGVRDRPKPAPHRVRIASAEQGTRPARRSPSEAEHVPERTSVRQRGAHHIARRDRRASAPLSCRHEERLEGRRYQGVCEAAEHSAAHGLLASLPCDRDLAGATLGATARASAVAHGDGGRDIEFAEPAALTARERYHSTAPDWGIQFEIRENGIKTPPSRTVGDARLPPRTSPSIRRAARRIGGPSSPPRMDARAGGYDPTQRLDQRDPLLDRRAAVSRARGDAAVSQSRSFGRHVLSLRRARGMTQEVLAERSGLAVDTIRRLEHGSFSPSLDTLRKLCMGLDLMLSTLFETFELGARDESR